MAVSFSCPSCSTNHTVDSSMAGTRARCNACGNEISIPQDRANEKIAIACGKCGQQHHADATLAGQSARCNCGHVIHIPGEEKIHLICGHCRRQHAVDFSMGGTMAKCDCGATLQVPRAPGQFEDLDEMSDLFSGNVPEAVDHSPLPFVDLSAAPALLPSNLPAGSRDSTMSVAEIYSYAIRQVGSGVKPKRVVKALIDRGVDRRTAESAVDSALSDDQRDRIVAREQAMENLMGNSGDDLGCALMVFFPFVIFPVYMIRVLFNVLYNLIVLITGRR